MAAYSGGSVRVTAGSNKVYGTITEFITYVQTGDLFKLTSENNFYNIAAINTATELTLTSRYSNVNLQNAVSTNLASVNTATINYSGNCGSFTPVIQNKFWLVASPLAGGEKFTDDGAGVLIGENTPAGSGTIDYDSGAWAIVFGTPLTATVNLVGSFARGNSLSGLAYQAVGDFTPNYRIPEMSTNDVNFSHIYTQAMRIIDQSIRAATDITGVRVITASYANIFVSATVANLNAVNASFTNASIQKLKVTNASINSASINILKANTLVYTNESVVNATITNASIQKLKATNASINNASVNTLKVTGVMSRLAVVNATLTNASIQKLKVTDVMSRLAVANATLTNASIQKLKVLSASILEASIGTLKTAIFAPTNLSVINATITNASIQKLKVLNASILEASIGTLKTAIFAPTNLAIVNATITNASIQKLKVLNASILEASIGTLKVYTGNAQIGVGSSVTGVLNVKGGTSDGGAIINLGVPDNYNATITRYSINVLADDFRIGNNINFDLIKIHGIDQKIEMGNARGVDMAYASIAKLKVLNASITNATIGKLLVNASRLKVTSTYDGYSLNATMSATVAFGEVLYLDSTFDYDLANSATSGTLPITAMAVTAGTGRQNIILKGQVCNTSWNWSATALIYAAATDGTLTQKIPVGTGIFVQIVGHPLSADTMFFEPNLALVKVA